MTEDQEAVTFEDMKRERKSLLSCPDEDQEATAEHRVKLLGQDQEAQ